MKILPFCRPVSCTAVSVAAFFVTAPACLLAQSKSPLTQEAVPALVQEAVKYQLDDFHHDHWGLRYRVHRNDGKEDSERELIESADGNVARTLMHHGQPLTPEEDAAERKRLEQLSPSEVARHHRGSQSSDKFGNELISALPNAMIYTLVPGQPQLPQPNTQQIVLDFVPNPQYHPSTTAQGALPCIAGRVWIDAETHHLTRIELKIIKNVNLMMGVLARVYEGGTLSYEQHPVGEGHDAYTSIEIHVKLRELMVKNVPYDAKYNTTNVTLLTPPPPAQEAIRMLLAVPSTTKP